jgi:maspardin
LAGEIDPTIATDRKVRTGSLLVLNREWRYHVVGAGPPSLLLLTGSLGANAGTAKLFSENLPGVRVIVPEYAPVSTMKDCLQALDEILHQEGVDRVAVFGGSFGGLIAQSWASRHPDRVTHLLLSGTRPPDSSRVRSHVRALNVLQLIPLSALQFFLRIVLRILLGGRGKGQWQQEYLRLIASLTKEDLKSRYQLAIDFDRLGKLPQLADLAKVFILEGERDRVASVGVRKKLRDIYPQADSHVFKGAGHSAIITHSEEWSRAVIGFINCSAI